MVVRGGGFAATVWYPVALFLVAAVLTVALSAAPRLASVPHAVLAAVGCLAGFTLWSFATIGWAAVRSSAWYGSDRDALYLLVFALLACWAADATSALAGAARRRGRDRGRGRRHRRAGDRPPGRRIPDRLTPLGAARLPERDGGAVHDHGLADARARVAALAARSRARPRVRPRRTAAHAQPARPEQRLRVHAAGGRHRVPDPRPGEAAVDRNLRLGGVWHGSGDPARARRLPGRPCGRPACPEPGDRPRARVRGRRRRRRLGAGTRRPAVAALAPHDPPHCRGAGRDAVLVLVGFTAAARPWQHAGTAWHSFKYRAGAGGRVALRRARQQPVRLLAGRAHRVRAPSDRRASGSTTSSSRTCSSGTATEEPIYPAQPRRSASSRRPVSSAPPSSPASSPSSWPWWFASRAGRNASWRRDPRRRRVGLASFTGSSTGCGRCRSWACSAWPCSVRRAASRPRRPPGDAPGVAGWKLAARSAAFVVAGARRRRELRASRGSRSSRRPAGDGALAQRSGRGVLARSAGGAFTEPARRRPGRLVAGAIASRLHRYPLMRHASRRR